VICTLDQGAAIRMEFTTSTGKGYVPAERNRPDDDQEMVFPCASVMVIMVLLKLACT
jgi:DNA-directed RNA polymerase subunit alpha